MKQVFLDKVPTSHILGGISILVSNKSKFDLGYEINFNMNETKHLLL
jgi:hypothetical protein